MKKIRYGLQAGFIGLMSYIGYRHQLVGGGPQGAPPIDAYCPLGAVETLITYLSTGNLVDKTAFSNMWILGALVIAILVSGAIFCGWLCPLGGLSDWLYNLRRKFYNGNLKIPSQVNKVLSYGRYVMLGFILYFSWNLGRLWFEEYDPFKLIFHFNVETITGWVIIGLFVILSMLIERLWCRFLCPLGAIVGLISKLSWFKIERKAESCINCKKCEGECPTGVAVQQTKFVNDTKCISCFKCVEICPVKETLTIKAKTIGSVSTIKPVAMVLVGLTIFAGILGIVQLSGNWNAKNPNIKLVAQITEIDEIKGWMKWNEVVTTFGVDEQKLAIELNLPTSFDRNNTLKKLGQENNFTVEKVKEIILQLRKN